MGVMPRSSANPALSCCSLRRWIALFALAAMLSSSAAPAADKNDEQFEEARVHWQRGRIDEALELYDALAQKDAEPARLVIGRSRCLESRGEWKKATEVLETAAKEASADAQL